MTRDIDYSCFMQNNPRYNENEAWTEKQFPKAQYRYFEEAGCLVCALAFLLHRNGIDEESNIEKLDPWTLNERLIEVNAFSSAADLKIGSVSRLYPIGYLGEIRYSRKTLIDNVRQGYYCLIVVKGCNGPFHFIALEELTEDDAVVFDPAAGRRYLSEYADVYQIRLFRKMSHIKESEEVVFDCGRDRSGCRKSGRIAICFDDGPSGENTDRVLDILEANGVKGSFFMLGNLIGKHESNVLRMVRQGHQVGVHGWDHFYLNAVSEEECRYSLSRTIEEISRVCQVRPVVFRPPGGYADDTVLRAAKDAGLAVIGWSVDSRDWLHEKNAEVIAESVLSRISDGDIVLIHDIFAPTADALEIMIPKLKQRGLIPVTLDELAFERGGLEPGRVYNWF